MRVQLPIPLEARARDRARRLRVQSRGQRAARSAIPVKSIGSAYLSTIGRGRSGSSDRIRAEAFPRREAIILFERLSENQSRILMPRCDAHRRDRVSKSRRKVETIGKKTREKRKRLRRQRGCGFWPEGFLRGKEKGEETWLAAWSLWLWSARESGKGLYALSSVRRGSHGFQPGIFGADRHADGRTDGRTDERNEKTQPERGRLPPPAYLPMHRLTFQCVFKRYDSFIRAI